MQRSAWATLCLSLLVLAGVVAWKRSRAEVEPDDRWTFAPSSPARATDLPAFYADLIGGKTTVVSATRIRDPNDPKMLRLIVDGKLAGASLDDELRSVADALDQVPSGRDAVLFFWDQDYSAVAPEPPVDPYEDYEGRILRLAAHRRCVAAYHDTSGATRFVSIVDFRNGRPGTSDIWRASSFPERCEPLMKAYEASMQKHEKLSRK